MKEKAEKLSKYQGFGEAGATRRNSLRDCGLQVGVGSQAGNVIVKNKLRNQVNGLRAGPGDHDLLIGSLPYEVYCNGVGLIVKPGQTVSSGGP